MKSTTEKYLKSNKKLKIKKLSGNGHFKTKRANHQVLMEQGALKNLKIDIMMMDDMKVLVSDLGRVMEWSKLKSILKIFFSKKEKWIEEVKEKVSEKQPKNKNISVLKGFKKVILKYLKTKRNEISVIFKVRLYASMGKAEKALKVAEKALGRGLGPDVEFVYPSLIAFGVMHHIPNVFEIEKLCNTYEIELTENQYKYIFQAFENFGDD